MANLIFEPKDIHHHYSFLYPNGKLVLHSLQDLIESGTRMLFLSGSEGSGRMKIAKILAKKYKEKDFTIIEHIENQITDLQFQQSLINIIDQVKTQGDKVLILISSNSLSDVRRNTIGDIQTRLTYFEESHIKDPDFEQIPQIIKGILEEVKIELGSQAVNLLARSVNANYLEINNLFKKVFNLAMQKSKKLTVKDCEGIVSD